MFHQTSLCCVSVYPVSSLGYTCYLHTHCVLCYLCVLVFRFPAWRWCIKSNLPALTVIVRRSAPTLPRLVSQASAGASVRVFQAAIWHLSVYVGQLNVHCLLPRRIPVVLPLRPHTCHTSCHTSSLSWRRNRTRQPSLDILHCSAFRNRKHLTNLSFLPVSPRPFLTCRVNCRKMLNVLSGSQTRRETCVVIMSSPLLRRNYKVIWAY